MTRQLLLVIVLSCEDVYNKPKLVKKTDITLWYTTFILFLE